MQLTISKMHSVKNSNKYCVNNFYNKELFKTHITKK